MQEAKVKEFLDTLFETVFCSLYLLLGPQMVHVLHPTLAHSSKTDMFVIKIKDFTQQLSD